MDGALKTKLEKLEDFQDTFIRDKKAAEEKIKYMPCHMLDEDYLLLMRQKSHRDGYYSGWLECMEHYGITND